MPLRNPLEPERPSLSRRACLVIFFLALGLRLAALAELAESPWNEVLLGVVYALFGHVPDLVRVLQCVLAAGAAVCIACGATALAAPHAARRAGMAAGVLAALYGPALWYDLQIEKTSLATSLTALLFFLAVARGGSPGLRWPLGAGIALGALVLLRENAAVLLLPLAWAFARRALGRGRALAALAAGLVLVLAPVALRNWSVGGVLLPTASNAGVNFYIGNGAEADGQYRPLVAGRGHPDFENADATRIAEGLAKRELSPAGVSRFWFALALEEIADEPGHFAFLLLHKARLLSHRSEVMDAVAWEVFRDESLVLRVLGVFSFGVLLSLCLAGAVLAWGRPHSGVTLASAVLVALSIVSFFVVGRFRLGLVPFALPFAGIALAEWRATSRGAVAAVLFAAGALAAWWPLPLEGDPRAASASNLASELLRRDDASQAETWARRARERDPRSAEAAYNLGVALRRLERHAEAAEPFVAAMRLEPDYSADCLAELGAIRALAGDAPGARSLLEQALALDPAHSAALGYLATLDSSK